TACTGPTCRRSRAVVDSRPAAVRSNLPHPTPPPPPRGPRPHPAPHSGAAPRRRRADMSPSRRQAGATAASGQEWRAGRLMIRQDPNAPGQARVIGSLTGDTLHVLLDAVSSGVSVLDLSDVNQADQSRVRALARLLLR